MKVEHYRRWVGRPCPKCGSSLLTLADYEAVIALTKALDGINFWFGWLAYLIKDPNKRVHCSLKFSGKGDGKVSIVDARPAHSRAEG